MVLFFTNEEVERLVTIEVLSGRFGSTARRRSKKLALCKAMEGHVDAELIPVDSTEDPVEGADIIACAAGHTLATCPIFRDRLSGGKDVLDSRRCRRARRGRRCLHSTATRWRAPQPTSTLAGRRFSGR